MAPSTNPIRLRVADRFIAVLAAITAGATYWYTPHEVKRDVIPYENAKHGPVYSVFTEGAGPIQIESNNNIDETFYIAVDGIVFDRSDPVAVVEKALMDVRLSIDTDSINPAANTLGTLCYLVRMDESPDMDYWENYAAFRQRFRIQIQGIT